MTRDQIAARVRNNLNDAGITYYSDSDINEAIQDGYDEVAVYCECIEKNTDLPFVSNQTYYDLWTLAPDYFRVTKVYNPSINLFMGVTPDRENVFYRQDWEIATHVARDFMILGPKYIGMSGRSSNATGNFRIWYKAQADILGASSTPQISSQFQVLLEYYATADLLEQNQEFKKANMMWLRYDKMIDDYRSKMQLLAKADQVFTRR